MSSVRHLGLFPWCFDPATSFFSKADLLKYAVPMWWRVKEWTLESSGVRDGEPQSATQVFKITDLPISFATIAKFQTETDLVTAGKTGTSFSELGPEYNWRFFPIIGAINICELVLGPAFSFSAGADDSGFVSTTGTFTTVGSISCEFCGTSFVSPLKYNTPEPEGGILSPIESLDSTLSATEYWPYDPGDGLGPIYDSATGAQLRQFPN